MKLYVKRMIEEHKELRARIEKLDAYVYGPNITMDSTDEVINKAVQLKGMRIYYDALSARLFNAGIRFSDNEYAEVIDAIPEDTNDREEPSKQE